MTFLIVGVDHHYFPNLYPLVLVGDVLMMFWLCVSLIALRYVHYDIFILRMSSIHAPDQFPLVLTCGVLMLDWLCFGSIRDQGLEGGGYIAHFVLAYIMFPKNDS